MSNSGISKNHWFVGAASGGTDDQTERFVNEGIWEHGFEDKYTGTVNSIQVGDRIAIKSSFTQKHNLPFDSRGKPISCMHIKAVGTVKKNFNNGHKLEVEWNENWKDNPRDWFFYTSRVTVWKLEQGVDWKKDALVDFAFNNKEQDIDKFLGDEKFQWSTFYITFADALLKHKNDRTKLMEALHKMNLPGFGEDEISSGAKIPHEDYCPFSTMGIFNRGSNAILEKKMEAATKLAAFLEIKIPTPDSFEAIPTLNTQNAWFFAYKKSRKSEDIDILWDMFEAAIEYADDNSEENKTKFITLYPKTLKVKQTGLTYLTIGLYWIRPWDYLPLDKNCVEYINETLKLSTKKLDDASDYLNLVQELKDNFEKDDYPVHSFPELSYAAWDGKAPTPPEPLLEPEATEAKEEIITPTKPARVIPYSIQNIIDEGCFVERDALDKMLKRFEAKKNIILQGPPGTGKTWLAKRLGYALLGQKDKNRITAMQFHPTMSYEDFVQGYRPNEDSKLSIEEGKFLKAIKAAQDDKDSKHVFVIEEINRGNPAQIFGEMLTLLEPDKRDDSNALQLAYGDESIWIPNNFYVIGTMNLADRSLAMLDFALRRRFAFIDLEPQINDKWLEWMKQNNEGINDTALRDIQNKMNALNDTLGKDNNLGEQYKIGHSYITSTNIEDANKWFCQIVETEIYPLLREYWFDDVDKAKEERIKLLSNLDV